MMAKKFILLLLIAFSTWPQSFDDVNKIFNKAVQEYQNQKYASSLSGFQKIAAEFQPNPKTSASLLFIGKINLQLDNYIDAEGVLKKLIQEYPETKYREEAFLTISQVFIKQKKYLDALETLSRVIDETKNTETKNSVKSYAEKLALGYVSSTEIESLYNSNKYETCKPFLLLLLAKKNIMLENYSTAKNIMVEIKKIFPTSNEAKIASELAKDLNKRTNNKEKPDVLAVLLPMSFSEQSAVVSKEILDGIKYSLAEYNSVHSNQIGLAIYDTELSKDKIAKIYDDLKNVEKLKGIIGPIYSSEVKEAIEVFSGMNVPIISPTATDDYLTGSNPNFFQANPPITSRAKLMAQYVYYVENKRNIGIINSIEGYSPALSVAFAQEFEKLGGRIIFRESYKRSNFNLTEQQSKIVQLQRELDGLYVPLSDRNDIPVILSLLSQTNLNLPIYGDQDWMTSSGLENAQILYDKLIFSSDYFLKFNDEDYQKFSKAFYSKTGIDANRNVLYGYDTMKYLLTVMRNSFSSSEGLKQKMISGISSTGFHNNICFGSARINKYMNIIKFTNGKFELIDKFKSKNE